MSRLPDHQEDEVPSYILQSGSGSQALHWSQERRYTQVSNQVHPTPPYAMAHPQPVSQSPWPMEPAPPMSDYQFTTDHLGYISQIRSSNPSSVHSPLQNSPSHPMYSPPSSGGSYPSPLFQNISASSSITPSTILPSRRNSPQESSSLPANFDSFPEDVRQAMQVARASVEFQSGVNVPAEILMPTVQKLDKDRWVCRICGKEHKRRDHTLTHVRTAHLDNKGYRCTFDDCDSAFGRKGDLDRHISSTHQGEFEALCPYCNSQLHRKDNLNRHIKSCKAAPLAGSGPGPSRSEDPSRQYHAPYPTVRRGPSQGHGHLLALNKYISSSA